MLIRQKGVKYMGSLKESIYQKHGFIYQIGEAYYAIGANIFAQITDSAEIDNMELLSNALNKNNERQISKYLDKVIRIADTHRVDAREHLKQQERLYAFIDELEKSNPEGYMSLQKQFAQFEELFDRYSKYGVTIQSNAN